MENKYIASAEGTFEMTQNDGRIMHTIMGMHETIDEAKTVCLLRAGHIGNPLTGNWLELGKGVYTCNTKTNASKYVITEIS